MYIYYTQLIHVYIFTCEAISGINAASSDLVRFIYIHIYLSMSISISIYIDVKLFFTCEAMRGMNAARRDLVRFPLESSASVSVSQSVWK